MNEMIQKLEREHAFVTAFLFVVPAEKSRLLAARRYYLEDNIAALRRYDRIVNHGTQA